MQDIAPLLQPDRGQAATPLHLVDKKASRTGSRRSPSEHARRCRCRASRARASSSPSCPTRATAGRRCSASPMSRSSAPGASPRAPRRCRRTYRVAGRGPGPAARLAARAIPVRRLSRERKDQKGPSAAHRRAGADRGDGAARQIHLSGPRPRQYPGRRPGSGRLQAAVDEVAREAGAKVRSTAGAALDKGFRWSRRSAAPPRPTARRA